MEKLVLEHVSYIYGQGTPFEQKALDDVTASIRASRITGIIGHTGSGKSTMMQLFNGLSQPTSGRVLLDGFDINISLEDAFETMRMEEAYRGLSNRAAKKAIREELARRRRNLCFRVGLVMQYPEHQLFEETVEKDIAFGPRNMGLSEEEIALRVREAASFTAIPEELLSKSPFDLSGGQKRRVAIAGIIAMRPEILVLDEPAAGLDPQGRDYILQGIYEYQRRTGCTVLIVSHSMEDMARYCDDLVVLAGAKVVMQGTREEVFSRADLLADIGLDVPEITRLVKILRAGGMELPSGIYTVDEARSAILSLLNSKTKEGYVK